MKKLQLIILILLIGLWGFWFQIKKENTQEIISDVAGEKVTNTELKITFLDIGQGDATFIEFQNGEQMLVDCAIDDRILEALGRVMAFNDKTIDYLVVTHPDLDHYGGCVDVMDRFYVKEVWYNGFKKEHDTSWQEFWYAMNDGSHVYTQIATAKKISIASTTIDILYPDHDIEKDKKIPGDTREVNANDTSIVMKVTYDGIGVLLTGDAEEPLESYLVQTYGDLLTSQVLKMGHHGSDTSSSPPFLDTVQPTDAIASAGVDNKYGHPSRRVLKRYERLGTNVWRTDVMGDISLQIAEKEYRFTTQF